MEFDNSEVERIRSDYTLRLRETLEPFLPEGSSIYLTGSYASGLAGLASDMDVHIITGEPITSFDSVHLYLEAELAAREQIQAQHSITGLYRHPSSFFSSESYQLHLLSLPWRYGLPLRQGEHYLVLGHPLTYEAGQDRDLLVDLLVTTRERLINYQARHDPKWLILNQRDLQYFSNSSNSFDNYALAKQNYEVEGWSSAQAIQLQERTIQGLEGEFDISAGELEKRKIIHKLTWTGEKVAWELLFCAQSRDYFEQYKKGFLQKFGFTPAQIVQLIDSIGSLASPETSRSAGQLRLILAEMGSSRAESSVVINDLYPSLQQWTLSALKDMLLGA